MRIILNSYGGSCNAATRMYDDIRAYPGRVHLIISGTAASAATVLAMAADRLEMTPGSLYMIHDPLMGAYGNEADLTSAIELLRACKESIINIYRVRSFRSREELSELMNATTWMDANQAQENGLIDGIVAEPFGGIDNAAFTHTVDKAEAEKQVNAWLQRHSPTTKLAAAADVEHASETVVDDATIVETSAETPTEGKPADASLQ